MRVLFTVHHGQTGDRHERCTGDHGCRRPAVRITTWTFGADRDNTGWHLHEHDYIVVPVTGGTFAVTAPDGGTRELTQLAGSPYLGTARTEHDVANVGGAPAAFVEIELKR